MSEEKEYFFIKRVGPFPAGYKASPKNMGDVLVRLPNNWRVGNLCCSPFGHIFEESKCVFCQWEEGM